VFKDNEPVISDLEKLIKSERFNEIFLLGDMFDFYFDYKHFIPKQFFNFFDTLKDVSKTKKIYLIPGNHDYWLGGFFKDYLGCIMIK